MHKKIPILIFASVFCIIIITIEIILAIYRKDILANFEWYGKVFVSLVITLVLSFATKSYAKVTGTYLSNKFQLNGAIVVFVVIFLSSYFKELFIDQKTLSFSVQVKNYSPDIMPEDIHLYFLKGTYRSDAQVESEGIANFLNIPVSLKDSVVELQLQHNDGFEINKNDAELRIANGVNIKITLLKKMVLKGQVFNNGKVVDSAAVNIEDLDTVVYTQKDGKFEFNVPMSQLYPSYAISIIKGQLKIEGNISINSFSEYDFKLQ